MQQALVSPSVSPSADPFGTDARNWPDARVTRDGRAAVAVRRRNDAAADAAIGQVVLRE
jgi:hypothetical protein